MIPIQIAKVTTSPRTHTSDKEAIIQDESVQLDTAQAWMRLSVGSPFVSGKTLNVGV